MSEGSVTKRLYPQIGILQSLKALQMEQNLKGTAAAYCQKEASQGYAYGNGQVVFQTVSFKTFGKDCGIRTCFQYLCHSCHIVTETIKLT